MSKRKYTHMKELEVQILSMRESGMTRQEIADELGLEKGQIKNWIARYNRRGALLMREPKQNTKGRPRKDGQPPMQDIQKELDRLRMENKLLRDFLRSTERK